MNSVIAFYQKISDPIQAAESLGTWLARSQMMGPITAQQGAVIAFDILAKGVPISEPILMYYVVCNRLTMKADVMLAEFNNVGGTHRIISNTPEAATIELSIDGETREFTITWEEAKQEAWPYGKDKKLKDTWKGPVGRADMLWARTISRGVRKMKPSVVAGRYTPEEIQDLPEYAESIRGESGSAASYMPDVDLESILKGGANGANGEVKKVLPPKPPASIATPAATPAPPTEPTSTVAAKPVASADGNDNDAQKAVPGTPQASGDVSNQASQASQSSEKSDDGFATAAQSSRIRELFAALSIPLEAQQKALAKRNVTALRSLTFDQAAELLANLEAKYESLASHKVESACTGSQMEAIQRIVGEFEENDPKFVETFETRLAALGKRHLGELSIREADAVLASLVMEEMSSFFERSLTQLMDDHAALKVHAKLPTEPQFN